MSTARTIAAEMGVATADRLETPPETIASADPALKGKAWRWTKARRDMFGFLGPVSLSLVATDGPVSITLWDRAGGVKQRFGHNRGIWPARIESGSTRNDAATTKWDRNPFFFLGTQVRLWFMTEAERDRTSASVVDLIALRAERDGGLEQLEKGFEDLGAELDLELFGLEMVDIAKRVGAVTWDDIGLLRWFDDVSRRCDAIAAEKGVPTWGAKLAQKIALADVERARKAVR